MSDIQDIINEHAKKVPFWYTHKKLGLPFCKLNGICYWKENERWTCIVDNIKYSQNDNGFYEPQKN
jgi:hypothetical protein